MSKSFALWLLIIVSFLLIAMPVSLSAKEITFRAAVIDYDTRAHRGSSGRGFLA